MALTRKLLTALGITEQDKQDQIIDAHSETVEGLKKELNTAKETAANAETLAKERDDLKAQLEQAQKNGTDAAAVRKQFDDYKAEIAAKEATAQKSAAITALLEKSGVNRAEFRDLLSGKIDLNTVELENGAIKDADKLVDGLKASYAGCFGTIETGGTPPITPPSGGKNDTVDAFTKGFDGE